MRLPLAVLLLCAAPVSARSPVIRDGTTPQEHAALVEAWMKALDSIEPGKELAAFLRRKPQRIVTDQRIGASGRWEPGRIMINGPTVAGFIDDALDAGKTPEQAAAIAAWRSLPSFAHEAEHARTRDQLETVTGARYDFPDRDDELMSLARELRVWRELRRLKPELLPTIGSDADLLKALFPLGPGDLPRLEQIVDATYSTARRVRTMPSEQVLAWGRQAHAENEAELAKLHADVARSGPRYADSYRPQLESKLAYRARYESLLALASDPERYVKVRAYFVARHQRLTEEFPRWPR